MAVDYTTPIGQVRLIIGDLTVDDQIFGDAELEGFLAITNDSVKRAAAEALDTIASSEALISKKITTQDRSSDGPAVADALRKHAASLRARATEEEDDIEQESFFSAFNITGPNRVEGEEARVWHL